MLWKQTLVKCFKNKRVHTVKREEEEEEEGWSMRQKVHCCSVHVCQRTPLSTRRYMYACISMYRGVRVVLPQPFPSNSVPSRCTHWCAVLRSLITSLPFHRAPHAQPVVLAERI